MGHVGEARMGRMGEGSVDNYMRSVSRWCIRFSERDRPPLKRESDVDSETNVMNTHFDLV